MKACTRMVFVKYISSSYIEFTGVFGFWIASSEASKRCGLWCSGSSIACVSSFHRVFGFLRPAEYYAVQKFFLPVYLVTSSLPLNWTKPYDWILIMYLSEMVQVSFLAIFHHLIRCRIEVPTYFLFNF